MDLSHKRAHTGVHRRAPSFQPFTGPVNTSGIVRSLISRVRTVLSTPEAHQSARFGVDYLEAEVLSKFCDSDKTESKSRRDLAIQKFLRCEEQCRLTNLRLRSPFVAIFPGGATSSSILFTARRKIERLLAIDCDHRHACGCLEQFCDPHFQFGPGVTLTNRATERDLADKYNGAVSCTYANLGLALRAIARRPLWQRALIEGNRRLEFCEADKITTVPKNSTVDRVICIQPSLNIFVQKGIGAFIRGRLKKVGIDLNDQGINAGVALSQSRFQNLATVDLSSASDTISYEIVRQLLPEHVFNLLEQSRLEHGVLPCGTEIRYHKFSAMGNGYTFELESLIFWAICSSVIELLALKDNRCFVYGDDIIVPCDSISVLAGVLEHFGFTLNTKKTHVNGNFRESCGMHGLDGTDVTPFYVRSPFDLPGYFSFHNRYVEWVGRLQVPQHLKVKLYGLAQDLRNIVKEKWRILVPSGIGDVGFVCFFDELCPPKTGFSLSTFRVKVFKAKARLRQESDIGPLIKFLSVTDGRLKVAESEVRGDRLSTNARGRVLIEHVWWCDPFF